MLNLSVKNDIRDCYKNIKEQLDNFILRKAQSYLVAQIAKTLAGEYSPTRKIVVAEAGTGIGKSLAYLLGAIPFALNNNKKIVISTATITLQEQLIKKDLPFFRRICSKEFSFILAKGRQRYCCRQKLAQLSESNTKLQQNLFKQETKKLDNSLIDDLHNSLVKGQWQGCRDSWPTPISDDLWQQIVSDKHTCHLGLSAHRQCPFAKAREHMNKADVIVTNHSLLMADLTLGGGVILTEPEQTIYLIDEAHHLPIIARDHSAAFASLIGACSWLEKLNQSAQKLANAADIKSSQRYLNTLLSSIKTLIPSLYEMRNKLKNYPLNEDNIYRFKNGQLPEDIGNDSATLRQIIKKTHQSLAKLHDLIADRYKEGQLSSKIAEPILAESAFFLQRMENLAKVWTLMAQPNAQNGAPLARWIEKCPEKDHDLVVHVSPLEIGWQLDKLLWSRAAGAALVSATLRALNSFSYFCRQIGLQETDGTCFIALPSPFNYQQNATLHIPKMAYEPQQNEFIDSLPEVLLHYLDGQTASLVLFSSYRKMNQVANKIRNKIKEKGAYLHVQGESSRQHILTSHKKHCEQAQASIIFGTGSFSEGLDLPGNLLTNLIITQLPFAVPTSPIEQAYSEYIEQKGGNAFLHIAVPQASKKLIQSVGRLLRKEQDVGQVVLLDRRIISKRYGKMLLDSLPPFKQSIEK